MNYLFYLISFFTFQIICEKFEPLKLVLVRNGESEWNKLNLFTGWTDIPLSEKGREESIKSGKLLKEAGFKFDFCYTSVLKRAIQTAFYILDELDQLYIPVYKNFCLNERHYGALQGLNKKEANEKYGADKVKAWRRAYDIPPPKLEENDERNPANQEQYKNTAKSLLPLHESLKKTTYRVIPYFNDIIGYKIKMGKKVLIVSHGDSLRALVKYLDFIPDDEVDNLDIPLGVPLIYELDRKLNPIRHYYLGDQKNINDKINSIKKKDTIKNN